MVVKIDFNNSLATSFNAVSNTTSFFVDSNGRDRFLVVGVSLVNSISQIVSSITYAGQSLTSAGAQSGSTLARIEIWYLVNPPTGANNLVTTLSASTTTIIGVTCWNNVDQQDPYYGSFSSTQGNDRTGTLNFTNDSDSTALCVVGKSGTGTFSFSNPTFVFQRWNILTTFRGAGATRQAVTNTSLSITWTSGGKSTYAMGLIVMKPVRIPPVPTNEPVRLKDEVVAY